MTGFVCLLLASIGNFVAWWFLGYQFNLWVSGFTAYPVAIRIFEALERTR